ncbi:hypothetical protein H6F50_09790 [Coleofasciculus sp. FACHB-712]|uniref:hypothetical protein n=1 Tax=Coleofasciculus sp. FACHB-712 TaxID=2692789 RepID=UPI001688F164|nr:hypothetical protein [Coleofasciculus sp. FACHB-712]MBD1942643.1 hypothetical protein [Coleofasciculus sp. FACHB-712]
MSQRRVQIVILCEDRQQEVFARYFLKKRGFTGRLRAEICPPGSQSGEQYVRSQYSAEVKAYRQNKNRVSIGLVVLIDADTDTSQERLNQLANGLREASQENRQSDEAIAIFVPKRNIETWIHYLQGEPVNEEDTYSKFLKNEASCKPYVENLADQCRSQNLPEDAPDSLQTACGELERLLPLLE